MLKSRTCRLCNVIPCRPSPLPALLKICNMTLMVHVLIAAIITEYKILHSRPLSRLCIKTELSKFCIPCMSECLAQSGQDQLDPECNSTPKKRQNLPGRDSQNNSCHRLPFLGATYAMVYCELEYVTAPHMIATNIPVDLIGEDVSQHCLLEFEHQQFPIRLSFILFINRG